ncbi:MAG: 4-hydroxy-tetrahydrodipicolinate reductase [Chelatococcus sp.]|uniref:4-hydroxy-tetrahydrodipicolinate reductase n=1 Tax=Chelatococcus sp. TaxID=1953771 RepID=UPI0025BD828C|nr:4-hydroxy-tetrahydrodipicolinate reductase [Chelatococcus sp.]MBX3536363.1 4-hydroxy-tetrahydrodipicolinate reductase [Chelatococcus sp.]
MAGIRIVVAGATGWVGRALVPAVIAAKDLVLAGAVSRGAAGQDAGEAIGQPTAGVIVAASLRDALAIPSDVVIDYTKPHVVKGNALMAIEAGRHVVIGTSGLSAEDYAEIDAAARKAHVGVLAAGNFSITATLLKRFALEAARYVPDVEIVDYAAASKPDVPSGTGRELAEVLGEARQAGTAKAVADLSGLKETRGASVGAPIPVQVHSLRLPGYVLSCEAHFGLPDERLLIRHDAGSSAAPYVAGTLLAARRVAEQPGLRRGLDSLMA